MASIEELNAPPDTKKDTRSSLMKAKSKSLAGQKVNACPYGCKVGDLDEHGYCKHLVGFTEDKKTYEPMVRRGGRRIVQVPMKPSGEMEQVENDDGTYSEKPIMVPDYPRCERGDVFVQITTSFRVYRDVQLKKAAS